MNIRTARADDLQKVLALIGVCIRDTRDRGMEQWPGWYPGREVLSEDIRRGSMFVAEIYDRIAGMVVLHPWMPEAYRSVAWKYTGGKVNSIHRLAVHPADRKAGLARQLLAFAEDAARQAGYRIIRLDTYSRNPAAFRFYKKAGYHYAGDIRLKFMPEVYRCFEKALYI